MAHKKAAGSAANGRDSNPKYLGVKINHGQKAGIGQIILRQRGNDTVTANKVSAGNDFTIFDLAEGVVEYSTKRKTRFNNKIDRKKIVNVQIGSASCRERV